MPVFFCSCFRALVVSLEGIAESKEFSLRIDAVNVLNHPTWANPNTNIDNTPFGRITNTVGTPRTTTFNARGDF